ncbi:MAG TPA: hypothetical protein VFF60_11635 [Candidatus Binatus sp.]|nr:hypothetical protein [Candidatus Binatus sp.]
MNPDVARYIPYITIGLVLVVVAFRVRRMMREVRWNPTAMWIVPVIFVLLTAAIAIADRVTSGTGLIVLIFAFALGIGLGWLQGMHTAVRVDKAAHAMYVKLSPIGAAIFLVVIFMRFAVRGLAGGFSPTAGPPVAQAGPDSLVVIVSVALLALIAGMSIGVRAYLQREFSQAA